MSKKYLLLLSILFSGFSLIGAFEISQPFSLLGLTVKEVFDSTVKPDEIFPNRGVQESEDNVIFYYSGGFYLFLYENRVWQVRYDRNYTDSLLNLKIGMSRSMILSDSLEKNLVPMADGEDYLTFQIRETPYPVRIKLYFVEEKLDDLYIYRADF